MSKFAIMCERQITETQTLEFEADTLAEAFQMAALAYIQGRTGDDPTAQEYDWDDCVVGVTELDFTALSDGPNAKRICTLTLQDAEEATMEMLAEDYGVEPTPV